MTVASLPYTNHQLFLQNIAEFAPPGGYTLGRFAQTGQTLEASWQDADCIFLFLGSNAAVLDDQTAKSRLIANLKAYLASPLHQNVRFLWIENPQAELSQWRTYSLSVETTEQVDGNPPRSTISQLSYFDLRNYSFSIPRGTTIQLDSREQTTGFMLRRVAEQAEAFGLATGYGNHRLHTVGQNVFLPMEHAQAGCLQFDFAVPRRGDQTGIFGYPDLAHLDVGFRLFMRDPDFPGSGEDVYLNSHRYPLIDEDSEYDHGFAYYPDRIPFLVSLDPLNPLVPERTHFILQPPNTDFANEAGFPSAYRTNLGYSVHLKPVEKRSRLQFALRPTQLQPDALAEIPFYLVPAGDYEMVVPRYQAAVAALPELVAEANVICGLSGLEYLKVTTNPAVRLTFVPEQPAYARSYVSINALLRELPTILESFAQRTLPPDTTDLDMRIESQEGGDTEAALGIDDTERQKILDIVRQDYFPPRFQFTEAQIQEYESLEIVEELIEWLRSALQAATYGVKAGEGALVNAATTSWVYVRSDDGAVYYAQPDQAPLYTAEASSRQFLDFLEVPSVGLPAQLTPPQQAALFKATGNDQLAFPMLPYGNVDPYALADIRQLEIAVINTFRRSRIQQISAATAHRTPLRLGLPLVKFEPLSVDESDEAKAVALQEKIAAIGEILTANIDITIDEPTNNWNVFIDKQLKYIVIRDSASNVSEETLRKAESQVILWWKWYCQIQNDQHLEESSVDEQPAEEKTADALSLKDEPADEQPVDEQPVDEQPVDEQPVDEQPVDEQPADEQPVDEQPASDELSEVTANSEKLDSWLKSLAFLLYQQIWIAPERIMSFPSLAMKLDSTKEEALKKALAPVQNLDQPGIQVILKPGGEAEGTAIPANKQGNADTPNKEWKVVLDEKILYVIQQKNETLNVYSAQRLTGTTPQGLIATYSYDFTNIEQLQLMKDTKDHSISFVSIAHGSALKAALQSNQLFMVISDPGAVEHNFSQNVLNTITEATTSLDIQDWIFELGTEYWKKQGTLLIFKFHAKALLELAEDPDLWSMADDFNIDKVRASQNLVRLLKQAVEIGKSSDPKERRKYEVLARAATQPNWTGVLALNVHVPTRNLPDDLKALAAGIDADRFYAQYVGAEVTPVQSTGTNLVPLQSSLFGLIDYSNPNLPLADASGYNFHVPVLSVVFKNSEITDFAAEILLIMDRLFDEATTLVGSPSGKNIVRLMGVAEEHNGKVTYSFGFSGANRFLLSGKALQEVEIIKVQFVTDPLTDPKAKPLPVKGRFLMWGHLRFAYRPDFDVLSFGATPGSTTETSLAPGAEPQKADYLSMNNLQVVMSFELHETTETVNSPVNSEAVEETLEGSEATSPVTPVAVEETLEGSEATSPVTPVAEETSSKKVVTKVENRTFALNINQIAFDLQRSGWREHSLYEKFPLKFSGLRVVKNDPQALEKSGFMPVKAPGQSVELGDTWYGLTFELNLGSAGALAGSTGLVVSILAAWVPEADGLYMGLKLPGSSGGKREIVIQGLLKIAFKSIQFVVYPLSKDQNLAEVPIDQERQVGYLLKIKNVMLKFFILSFPPSGQTEFILFGDPRADVKREEKLLGWYAGYAR